MAPTRAQRSFARARDCLAAAISAEESNTGVSVALAPAPAPDLGNRAAAFHGSMGFTTSPITAEVDHVIVQQGRAVVLLVVIDTTGSLHGQGVEDLLDTMLVRLAPRFGT